MRIYQKLLKPLAAILLSTLLLGVVLVIVGSAELDAPPASTFSTIDIVGAQPDVPTSSGGTNVLNPDPPEQTTKLIFIHHSCGDNWLDNGNGDLGAMLGDNNYFVSDTYYDWGPADADLGYGTIGDHTDIGHWYNWFAGPNRDTYLSALYTTSNQHAIYSRPMANPGGENKIIMFKSCYPNSRLKGESDDPPTSGDNPLRGQSVSSEHHTIGNAKGIYNDILDYFETRQDKLFVVTTAPPVQDETYSENARAFNNWLVNDWLDGYAYHNVAVFDFYNTLTTNGGDPNTNDYGWSTGNHHRVVTTTTPMTIEHITDGDDDASPDVLEYPTNGDNHPNPAGNQKATGEFILLLNAYYHCWKDGECWTDATDWISVTAVTDMASIYPGDTAAYTLSVTASEGFTAPVTLTLQGAPPGTSASFDPNPVTPPGNSQLHITTTASTSSGTYAMTVTGASGQLTDTTSLTLTVNHTLTLNAQPDTHVVLPSDTAAYTLSVTASEGFTAPVTLTLQGAPPGTSASFDPNPVTPPGNSQLHITTTSTLAGTYPMTVTGASEMLTSTASLTLIVASAAPTSFTLSISPTSCSAEPNQEASYSVSVTGTNGFNQPVTLTIVGTPTGVDINWSANPITPGRSSTLTLSIPSNPPFDTHLFQVIGTAETQTVVKDIELIIDYPFKYYLPIILKWVQCLCQRDTILNLVPSVFWRTVYARSP